MNGSEFLRLSRAVCLKTAVLLVATATACLGVTAAVSHADDDFFVYSGNRPLASFAPGDVLKTRNVQYHILGIPTPLTVTQVLYRSTGQLNEPVANVTSIMRPLNASGSPKVVSYQSFYDSLNPADSPSRVIAGDIQLFGLTPGGYNVSVGPAVPTSETAFFAPLLLGGYTVVLPDTQGPDANFIAGQEYGQLTLDSLRALRKLPEFGVTDDTKMALMGYSGGGIASNWTAIMAPSYAPDIDKNLLGVAQAGLLVAPAHNLRYVSGSLAWAGIVNLAFTGLARSFKIPLEKYLNDYGKFIFARSQESSILNVYLQYPGLRFEQLVRPEFADPNVIPEYVENVNKDHSDVHRTGCGRVFRRNSAWRTGHRTR